MAEKNMVLVTTKETTPRGLKTAQHTLEPISKKFGGSSLDAEKSKGVFVLYFKFPDRDKADNFRVEVLGRTDYSVDFGEDLRKQTIEENYSYDRPAEQYDYGYEDPAQDTEASQYDYGYDEENDGYEEYDHDHDHDDSDYEKPVLRFAGGQDFCVCPSCGERSTHLSGLPCEDKVCPVCQDQMAGDNTLGMATRNVQAHQTHRGGRYLRSYDSEHTSVMYGEAENSSLQMLKNVIEQCKIETKEND